MVDGTKFVGANGDRVENDMYPTPEPGAVIGALFSMWRPDDLFVWEAACGNGALSTVLDRDGFGVYSTDLFDYGFGLPGVDFFDVRHPESETLITNPPWGVAREWITHAHAIGIQRLALLLPTTFFTTKKGVDNFEMWRPAFVLPLTWRLDFRAQGRPVQTCQWVVWDRSILGATQFLPLRKPKQFTKVRL